MIDLARLEVALRPELMAFEEPPVTVEQFVKDPEYAAQGEVAWPNVLAELREIFGDDPTRFKHQEAILCWAIGCLGGDTEVYDAATGRRWTMEEMARLDYRPTVVGVRPDGTLGTARSSRVWCSGVKPVLRVTLASGRRLIATPNHPFLTVRGWEAIAEVGVGGRVAVPALLPLSSQQVLSDDEAVFLAYVLADGDVTVPGRVVFVDACRETVEEFSRVAGEAHVEAVRRGATRVRLTGASRTRWWGWLESLGVAGVRSRDRRVPEVVMGQDSRTVGLFLSRLWACDGWVDVGRPSLGYASASEALARDVVTLLLRLGVYGRIRRREIKRGAYRGYESWTVEITEAENVLRFLNRVPPIPGKMRACEIVRRICVSSRRNPNVDVVPVRYGEVADRLRQRGIRMGSRLSPLRRLRWPQDQYPSRGRLRRIAEETQDPWLLGLSSPDLRWDRVVSLEPLDERPVYDMEVPGLDSFVAGDVLVHNSGKSFLVSVAFAYMLYWTLNLKNPQQYFGLAPGSTIAWLNQSINEMQAKRIVFHEVKERIVQAPWFRRHYLPLNPNSRTELRFPKNVVVFPGNSSMRFPAGYNLLGGVLDEAAWMTDAPPGAEKEEPAAAIYNSMRRRIRSRFGDRGLLVVISSPKHVEDFIERSYRFAKFGNPDRGVPPPERVYASRKALWEMKPGPLKDEVTGKWEPWRFVLFEQSVAKPDGGKEILYSAMVPEVFLPDFQANPDKAKRDLAAVASAFGQGWFWDPDIVWRPREAPGLPGYNPAREHPLTTFGQFYDWFQWPKGEDGPCVAHCDLSLTRDSTGVAVGHISGVTVIAGEKKPVITIDFMCELTVPPGGEIDFAGVRNLLYAIRDRGFPLKVVTFDGWQSADAQQILSKRGFETDTLSVDADLVGYETFREAVLEGRLDYYQYRPMYDCVRSLVLVRGKKVDHVVGGKKDVTDALAGVCRTLTERFYEMPGLAVGKVASPYVGTIRERSWKRRGVVAS